MKPVPVMLIRYRYIVVFCLSLDLPKKKLSRLSIDLATYRYGNIPFLLCTDDDTPTKIVDLLPLYYRIIYGFRRVAA